MNGKMHFLNDAISHDIHTYIHAETPSKVPSIHMCVYI